MISFDIKPESAPTSSGAKASKTSEKEPTLSFAELLKGASEKKDTKAAIALSQEKKESKTVQNGAVVLALNSEEKVSKTASKAVSKTESLMTLLKNSDKTSSQMQESLELNPKLASMMSPSELKTLIANAKEYLKSKILSSEEYKKAETGELPKTLKGLAELAKKFNIDVSKISIEDVQQKKAEVPHANKETKTETSQLKEAKAEVPHANKESKTEVSQLKEAKAEVPHANKEIKVETFDKEAIELKKVINAEELKTKEVKATPLFKAQESLEHTTEQLVHSKTSGLLKAEEKATKNRADETLKSLLHGEKPSQSVSALASNVSVVASNAIEASNSENDKGIANAFDKLLYGDTETKSESTKNSKVEGVTTLKADSFEVKLNEAKQMIRYLSADVRTAIEEYKAPFTRVKVQLNPQQLGEVELTIVQRGKNLHVNISSNTTAINTLAVNAAELKTQLNNNGINNATLNFNSSSDNAGTNQQQNQGQKRQEKEAHKEYNYFESEEKNEEILSSLEIVVPRYI